MSPLIQSSKIQIRFLGDPSGQFTKDLDLSFDSAAVFGQDRSKRYALVVEDGKVKSAHVEPDNTGVNGKPLKGLGVPNLDRYANFAPAESAAEKVLSNL